VNLGILQGDDHEPLAKFIVNHFDNGDEEDSYSLNADDVAVLIEAMRQSEGNCSRWSGSKFGERASAGHKM
jgi:hypothetical protein